jgi:hypothetical protein
MKIKQPKLKISGKNENYYSENTLDEKDEFY